MKKTQSLKWSISFFMLLVSLQISFAQQLSISGVIMDSNEEPIIGATILEVGTTNGTTSNYDGIFSLNVKQESTIQISFIGYESLKFKADNLPSKIVLQENATELSDLVVTGYMSQRKADLTGAVTVVDVKDIKEGVFSDPITTLQGKVPGMRITSTGSPSGSATIQIRGVGTLNNNDPLYIIDGMPTKSGIKQLNPSDIESLQVLRDASSASIYGSRASNGVIIITTKKAKDGDLRVDFESYLSASQYNSKFKLLDADGYGRVLWRAAINDRKDPSAIQNLYQYDWNGDYSNPILNSVTPNEFLDPPANTMRSANTDWLDAIMRTGYTQSYNVALSKGTKTGSSRFSINYYDNKGIIKESEYERITARLNTSYNLLDGKLLIGENLSLSRAVTHGDHGALDIAFKAPSLIPIHTIDGVGWGGPASGMSDRHNPVRIIEDNKQNYTTNLKLIGNIFATVHLHKNLTFNTNFGIDYINTTYRNMYLTYKSGFLSDNTNRVTNFNGQTSRLSWSNTLNYSKVIDKHSFDAVGGVEIFKDIYDWFSATADQLADESPEFMFLNAATGIKSNSGVKEEHRLLSYFGKINYNYNNKYLTSFTLRRDGSSRFGINNQYGLFPAFSFGWRINNEEFFPKNTVLTDLKLRFGWGQNGNQEINNEATYTIYVPAYEGQGWSTAYDMDGNNSGTLPAGYRITRRGNEDLKWETSTQTNIALDFELVNKLTGSLDLYVKETDDILVQPPYLAAVGEGGYRWTNGASLKNSGFELSLDYSDKTKNGIGYNISANVGHYKNEVTKLPKEVIHSYGGDGKEQTILGRPINSWFGYVADGIFKTQEEIDSHAKQTGKNLGRIRYKDINGPEGVPDSLISNLDRTWMGNPHPGIVYGVNFAFDYKNFDLTLFFQGEGFKKVDNGFYKNTFNFWAVSDAMTNKGEQLLDAWSPQNPNSNIPALSLLNTNDEGRFSTFHIESGGYLKLRTLQFGYSLNQNLINKIHMKSLRIYLQAQDVFSIYRRRGNTPFTGVDAENPSTQYPRPLILTIGINASF